MTLLSGLEKRQESPGLVSLTSQVKPRPAAGGRGLTGQARPFPQGGLVVLDGPGAPNGTVPREISWSPEGYFCRRTVLWQKSSFATFALDLWCCVLLGPHCIDV
jgi:hypothetical protein